MNPLLKIINIFDMLAEGIAELSLGVNEEYGEIGFNSKPTDVYLIRLVGAGYIRWAKVIKN